MVRSMARERMLDAAYACVQEDGWGGLRLTEVARRAEFSRQTVYNEFRSKEALGLALIERGLERFLDGVRERIEGAESLESAARAGIEYALRLAAEDALIASVLTSGRGHDSELLVYLTTRSEPVFDTATTTLERHAAEAWPDVDAESRSMAVEAIVRLTVSHVVQSAHDPAESAARIAEIVARIAYPGARPTGSTG
ncbi:DNA-binding transcriptional regulator, AcrR family [Streptacidiphilus jiangxiensis]|uniref:DNA-binding transcriptional regulator, AcrR family n=2 Tax=Streptacidiphilus jiangxiensis TaxID=235985 RepID=A0A1H7UVX6_STRJI|nr:DNA-binding transcriptional regulator, AcrR family [Streptacidiphilus jiangxiensis]